MSGYAYRLIFGLLLGCVLIILGVQAYWLRSFYKQKKQDFDQSVYSVLEQVAERLRERKNLQSLKMTYLVQNGDTILRTPSRHTTMATYENVKVVNKGNGDVITTQSISINRTGKKAVRDSVVIKSENGHVRIFVAGAKKQPTAGSSASSRDVLAQASAIAAGDPEISKLMNKIITEIKVMDTETENADSVKALIKKTLLNKGISIPFEFSLRITENSAKKILVQSDGFLESAPYYTTDLSARKVINKHDALLLQFNQHNDYVLAGMKGSLMLSLFFSLLIVSVFYYVIRLIRNQKKLTDLKTDFINNMTHELKTPIATISLATDAINNPMVKDDKALFSDYTRILKEENNKLNSHVERVLQMAMMDKGELHLNKVRVDVVDLLVKTIDTYKLRTIEQKAIIEFHHQGEALVIADKSHLQAVFDNLLDNALKYSGEGCKVNIDVRLIAERVEISFSDNGIGIDAAQQQKVFERFYRVQGGNLHDVKGFGLGLSYVKSIVEAHSGTIALKSMPGKGSEFVITLKAYVQDIAG